MARKEGRFRLKSITPFNSLKVGDEIPESDLCFQDDKKIYQYEYMDTSEEIKTDIKPGIFSLSREMSAIKPKKIEIRSNEILKTVTNTKLIVEEADVFFNNLEIYDQLGEQKSRKLLIYSGPGMGKTCTITDYCSKAVAEDPGTVVLIWPTSSIESHDVLDFLTKGSEYTKKCSRLILIMEDIGGGEREGNSGSRAVDSAMLDILDGIGLTFKLPTLIIATTNYPQNLLSALADRPGRFDKMIELQPPRNGERVELIKFIAKRELTPEELKAVNDSATDDFSIAHWKEVVIRSLLHKKSIPECIEELLEHKKRFKEAFESGKSRVGFGGFD